MVVALTVENEDGFLGTFSGPTAKFSMLKQE
jgi:hypothetical protein